MLIQYSTGLIAGHSIRYGNNVACSIQKNFLPSQCLHLWPFSLSWSPVSLFNPFCTQTWPCPLFSELEVKMQWRLDGSLHLMCYVPDYLADMWWLLLFCRKNCFLEMWCTFRIIGSNWSKQVHSHQVFVIAALVPSHCIRWRFIVIPGRRQSESFI